MKIRFRKARLSTTGLKRLNIINDIILEYQKQGYVLTLRQLYYQLVTRDVIPNIQSEYAKLSILLKEGRMGGMVDWDAIEDRLRKPSSPPSWDSPKDIMVAVTNQYELPRQKGQNTYLEVWVEKDALSGVLKRVTEKYHVPILVNRGYSSASAMFDSYKRFKRSIDIKKRCIVLYLGDYDPSGIDMIRDIRSRIQEFFAGDSGFQFMIQDTLEEEDEKMEAFAWLADQDNAPDEEDVADYDVDEYVNLFIPYYFDKYFKIVPIALTMQQIKKYKPPPNPAKTTDPRAKDFIALHGSTSWEVDALRPDVLSKLLEEAIISNIDQEMFLKMVRRENTDKKKLKSLLKYLK